VLLLRDVFDYSVREAASALELSEANIKTSLHRARGADVSPRDVVRIELDARGRIKQIHTILATPKLTRVPFEAARQLPWMLRLAALGVRGALARLRPAARRISPHLQVHPGSRAKR
jgi:hypothetical protein